MNVLKVDYVLGWLKKKKSKLYSKQERNLGRGQNPTVELKEAMCTNLRRASRSQE